MEHLSHIPHILLPIKSTLIASVTSPTLKIPLDFERSKYKHFHAKSSDSNFKVKLRVKAYGKKLSVFWPFFSDSSRRKILSALTLFKPLDQIFYITKGSLQSSKNTEGEYTFMTASDTN